MTLRPIDIVAKSAKWAVIILFLFITIMPLLWLLLSSFKTNFEFETNPIALPTVWQFQNYLNALQIANLPRLFLNSVIISTMATLLNLLVTSMAGYVFARMVFRFRDTLLNLILAGVLAPIIALMVPYFRIIRGLGIYDSYWGLMLTYAAINVPISLFLMHGFMRTIPFELEEAAIIDGCTFPQRFLKIVLPLSKLGLVTAGTFVFLYCWNEFIYALLLTASVSARTLQLGISFFRSQFITDFTSMFAAITLTIIPSILVYIFLHDRIIRGLTSGALKG